MIMSKNISLKNAMAVLSYLIPTALITGPFFSDLIISILALYFLILTIYKNLWIYYKNQFTYIFIFFYIYILIGSIISVDPLLSLESSLFYFRYLFFVLCIVYLIDHEKKFTKNFFIALIIPILIVVIDGYIQFLFGRNILGFTIYDKINLRISGLFDDESVMGRYLVYLMPLMISLFTLKEKIKQNEVILLMALLFLMDVLIFLSGERTSFFLLTLSTIIIVLLVKRFQMIRIFTFLISLIIIVLITNSSQPVKDRFLNQTLEQIGYDSEEKYIFSSVYQSHFNSAFKMFLDKPIHGHGVKTYRVVCKDENYYVNKFSCSTHPHNIFLQLLSETGIIGASIFIIIFLKISYRLMLQLFSIFNKKERFIEDYKVCLYSLIIIILFPIAPSLSFFNNWILIFYFLPIPFLLQKKTKLIIK